VRSNSDDLAAGTHITSLLGETCIPSDMCVGKHASLVICVRGNAIHGEMHITVTPGLLCCRAEDDAWKLWMN